MGVAVEIDGGAWNGTGRHERLVRQAANAALSAAGVQPRSVDLSISIADDDRVAELNRAWRAKEGPTNVLAFPVPAGFAGDGRSRFVGDVVLAAGVVAREAAEQGKTVEDHAAHLVVHGVLHLLGYDHGGAMERLEVDALQSLGIDDPYAAEKVKGS